MRNMPGIQKVWFGSELVFDAGARARVNALAARLDRLADQMTPEVRALTLELFEEVRQQAEKLGQP